jgi:hypothetical protein
MISDNVVIIRCADCPEELDYPLVPKDMFKKTEFIQLETNENGLLNFITDIHIIDTCIFIVSDKTIYRFSKRDGKFVSKIGGIGRGPGEYLSVNNIVIDEQERMILAPDLSQSRVNKYDFAGKFISSQEMGVNTNQTHQAFPMKDGSMLFSNDLSPYNEALYSIYNAKNDSVKDLALIGDIKPEKLSSAISKHPMTYVNDGIDCLLPYDNYVYRSTDEKHDFEPVYRIEHPGKMVPKQKIIENKEQPVFLNMPLMAAENYFTGFSAIFETSDKLLLNTYDNEGRPGFFYADTNSLEGKYYNYSRSPEEGDFFEIIGVSSNMFIAILDALRLHKWQTNGNFRENTNEQLQTVIENSNEYDNPCIAIYHVDEKNIAIKP